MICSRFDPIPNEMCIGFKTLINKPIETSIAINIAMIIELNREIRFQLFRCEN